MAQAHNICGTKLTLRYLRPDILGRYCQSYHGSFSVMNQNEGNMIK